MERIGFETTQNVFIEHNLASIGDRILAQLLDYLFMFAYALIAFMILNWVDTGTRAILIYVVMAPVVFYSLIFENLFHGQSPAKMILKIKVIKKDGSQPAFYNYLIRWVFRLVDILFMWGAVAIIFIAASGKGQRLGDLLAGTTVVKLKQKTTLEDTLFSNTNENHKVTYNEANLLGDKEIKTLSDVLSHHRKTNNLDSKLLAYQTKKAIEKKLFNGQEIKTDPIVFLNTIIEDYNFINKNKIS